MILERHNVVPSKEHDLAKRQVEKAINPRLLPLKGLIDPIHSMLVSVWNGLTVTMFFNVQHSGRKPK